MGEEADNPYRAPQTMGNSEPSARKPIGHNPAIVMFWMAGFGLPHALAFLGFAVNRWNEGAFLSGFVLFVSSFFLFVFWVVFIGTAKDLRNDFGRHHVRAKLYCTIAAATTFPLIPAVFVIWQINRRRLLGATKRESQS